MQQLNPPTLGAVAGEVFTPLEFSRLFASLPRLAVQPRGNGDPVIVLPGLGASNVSTALLRRYLTLLGYDVYGWNIGRNEGNVRESLTPVTEQVEQVFAERGREVHIIGWSLGGVIAREVARDNPGPVRQVITMGSPLVGGPKYTSLRRIREMRGEDVDAIEAIVAARESNPITVPVTSIYSKRDGIVGWQASIDRHSPDAEHFEVSATHFGLGISPEVFRILARKLAADSAFP